LKLLYEVVNTVIFEKGEKARTMEKAKVKVTMAGEYLPTNVHIGGGRDVPRWRTNSNYHFVSRQEAAEAKKC